MIISLMVELKGLNAVSTQLRDSLIAAFQILFLSQDSCFSRPVFRADFGTT